MATSISHQFSLGNSHAAAVETYKPAPIDLLVNELTYAFETHGKGEIIQQLLEKYTQTHTDWREYAHFCPHKYSRNLVARTKMYELMVICWGEGQRSPIHNHEVFIYALVT
jgi:predicted metal-dependent enzyme (double-stranded beta helix superfamily)